MPARVGAFRCVLMSSVRRAILINGTTAMDGAVAGTLISIFTVRNGAGHYAYTLLDPGAGAYFGLTDMGDGTAELRVVTPPSFAAHPVVLIQVEADNSVDAPIVSNFTIEVLASSTPDGMLDFRIPGNPLI